MVFPESSLKKENPALERQGRPFGHLIYILGCRQARNGEINVLQHMGHHHLAVVPSPVQALITGIQRLIQPGDIAVALDFLEVEIGPEEACKAQILVPDSGIFAMVRVDDKEIDGPEVVPAPGTGGRRHRPVSRHLGTQRTRNDIIRFLPIDAAPAGKHQIETVGI